MELSEQIKIPLRNIDKNIIDYAIISANYKDYKNISKEIYEKIINSKWHLTKYGYVQNNFGNLHRVLMGAKIEDPNIDHINGNKLDNLSTNLRFVTNSQNAQNKSKKKGCSSEYIGASFDKKSNKWKCQIRINGIKKSWTFDTKECAAYWYDTKAIIHHGSDAKINKISKPNNFIEPKEKIKSLPAGITMYKNKFKVNYGCEYIGLFKTLEEALNAQIIEKDKNNLEIQKNIESAPIKRNKENIATIITSKNEEILVSDENYYNLMKYTWWIDTHGYAQGYIGGNTIRMHVYLINLLNPLKEKVVDHINNIKHDNRIENLRIVEKSLNAHNKTKNTNKTSKYQGVCLETRSNKYIATIVKNRKQYYLGSFKTEDEAAKAYNKKALELYSTDAKLNILNINST